MSLPVVSVNIDPDVVIPCPDRAFQLRRAYNSCNACEHFDGVAMMSVTGNWAQRYAIRCRAPIERRARMHTVLED